MLSQRAVACSSCFPLIKEQPNLTKQVLLDAVPTLRAQRPFILCVLYTFCNYVAPGSSAIQLEQAGLPPVQQCAYSRARAGTESMHLGGHAQLLRQTTKHEVLFIFLNVHFTLHYIFYKMHSYFILLPALLPSG